MKGKLAAALLLLAGAAAAAAVAVALREPAGQRAAGPVVAPRERGTTGELVMYRSPSCGCCGEWLAYVRRHGFQVRDVVVDDLAAVKRELGVPEAVWSCHTAVLGGAVIEGHVPVEAVRAFASAPLPGAAGIAVPGMPAGSPGMTGELAGPLQVVAFGGASVEPFMTLERFAP